MEGPEGYRLRAEVGSKPSSHDGRDRPGRTSHGGHTLHPGPPWRSLPNVGFPTTLSSQQALGSCLPMGWEKP